MRLTRLLLLALLALALAPAAQAEAACTAVAAPGGSDGASGSADDPLRTVQAVIDRLGPGDTGCLRAGRYSDSRHGTYVADLRRPGRPGARITLRSFPGERATIAGTVMIARSAAWTTVSHLDLDATPGGYAARTVGVGTTIGVGVLGPHAVLASNDITNREASCVGLGGSEGWGAAIKPTVRGNRLHGCGTRGDKLEHAIYGNDVRGGRITGNVITDAAGFAVHLHGRDRGMLIDHNVMAFNGGGVIFSGAGSWVASRNVVTRNVITDSHRWPGITYWWGDGWKGSANRATRNCLARNADDGDRSTPGFSLARNLAADPGYRSASDLQLRATSPCRRLLGYDPAARLAGR